MTNERDKRFVDFIEAVRALPMIYDAGHEKFRDKDAKNVLWVGCSTKEVLNGLDCLCLGAIDGKHIHIRKPAKSGSLYFNYKDSFSIVLLGVCDNKYRLVYAKFGDYGRESDGGVFDRCDLKRVIDDNLLNFPGPTDLPGTDVPCHHYFVGDAAFPLMPQLIKPMPGTTLPPRERIYNYRISRGRRLIENVFGIMAAKWRVLLKSIETSELTADHIVKAVCVLHNFAIDEMPERYVGNMADRGLGVEDNGEWRREIRPLDTAEPSQLRARGDNNSTQIAKDQRTKLINFFNGLGTVEWQNEFANVPVVPPDAPVLPVPDSDGDSDGSVEY